MIYEVAIDPEVLLEWSKDIRDYRDFIRDYGVGTPKIVSSFPKANFRKLRQYLLQRSESLSNDLHKERYIEMVRSLDRNLYLREAAQNSSEDWRDLIVKEDIDFDAVIAKEYFPCNNLIPLSTLYDSELHLLKRQISFNRTPTDFIRSVKGFVNLTISKFVIIDAFCYQKNAMLTMSKIIDEIKNRKFKHQNVELIIIYKDNPKDKRQNTPTPSFFKNKFERIIGVLPNDITLKIIQLRESESSDVFHNRYILNDLGGITLGHGLDLSDNENTTDEITLLEKDIYEKRWEQFVTKINFDIVSSA